jgi:hypothetical protein
MSKQLAKTSAARETQAALACRLRQRLGRPGGSPTAGEVEIENVSPDVIEIQVTMHPLQYLNLVITDPMGNLVPAPPYGDMFSPRETPYAFRLAPGEKYTHNVSLLGNVPEDKRLAGSYRVRAIYDCDGLRAVSESLQVQFPTVGG